MAEEGSGATRVLEVRLTGPLQVRVGDRVVGDREIGGRRPRLLLAALALHPDHALTRDQLAEVLWGEALPDTWGAALRVTASKLRGALGALLGGDADLVVSTNAGYALSLPDDVAIVVDVVEARALAYAALAAVQAGEAQPAVDAVQRARPVLERAFLGEEAGPWVERHRGRLRSDLVVALEALAGARLLQREAVPAATAATAVLELEPYRESAHRLLMEAHALAGNPADALRAYERCRRRLVADLGTVPSEETQATYRRLLGEEPRMPAPSVPLPGRLRLVGRDRPVEALDQLLGGAVSGRGAIALLTGEAGIGKSRVARELAERARAVGARVLWGTCREPEWAPPFGAVLDLLPGLDGLAPAELTDRLSSRLVDDIDAVAREDRLQVREDLRRAVLAAAQVVPLVLVVDDVHWADEGTLAALRHLGPAVPAAPVLVVLTARTEEIAAEAPAGLALAALTRDPGVARLALAPLGPDEVTDLVLSVHAAAVARSHDLHAETGGNPFFVEAVLLHLLETGAEPSEGPPPAVRDVVSERVRRLGPDAQALLRTASLVEGAFSLGAVAAAADLDERVALSAIEAATAARIVEPTDRPDAYEFAHAIARQAIADELSPSRRVRLHRRVAEAIESACGGEPSPVESGEMAGQYHRSASLPGAERGVEHAVRAADHAEAAGGADRAAAFLGIALDLLPYGDPRTTRLVARRGLALVAGARHAEGAALLVRAADELAAAGDRRGAAELLADASWTAELAGHTEEAFSLASTGLELVAGGPEDDVWARLYLLDLRRQEADDPRGLGIPIMTPERRRAARLMHADPRWRKDMAWAVWDHRDEILASGTDDVWALTMWAGRYGEALPLWQRSATAAEARGQLAEAVSSWAGAASCAVALGHLADADRWTDRARDLARRIELRGAFALHLVGARDQLVHARADGFDDLMEWLAELTVYRTDRAQRWAEATTYAAMGRILAGEGRVDDARAMVDGVVEVLPEAPAAIVGTNRMVGDAVAACWLTVDTRHLDVLADAVQRLVVEPDFRCPMTEPRHVHARLLALAGDVDGARRQLADARAVAVEDGLRPLRVILDHDEALLLLRQGRAEEAAPYLDAASRRATQLGMVGWVRRAERLAVGNLS